MASLSARRLNLAACFRSPGVTLRLSQQMRFVPRSVTLGLREFIRGADLLAQLPQLGLAAWVWTTPSPLVGWRPCELADRVARCSWLVTLRPSRLNKTGSLHLGGELW